MMSRHRSRGESGARSQRSVTIRAAVRDWIGDIAPASGALQLGFMNFRGLRYGAEASH